MQKFDTPWLEDRLRKISALLIDAHRNGQQDIISHYASRLPEIQGGLPKRQFMRLIQVYHPDRLAVYVRQVVDFRVTGDERSLLTLEKFLEFDAFSGTKANRRQPSVEDREDFGFTESYGYDEGDFGYDEDVARDEDETFGEDDFEEENAFAAGSFLDAIKREFFGNLELYPSRHEIEQFAGELDLSDYNLNDLTGAEFCVNIFSLNLAMNRIDNVWPLRELSRLEYLDLSSNFLESADDLEELAGLKELDLSFNDIDDIAFLLKLPSLKCVSLVGNPLKDTTVLATLRERGVMVIL